MADERLYQFPSKPTPTPADIVYIGDAANSFNEVNSTIEEIISAYPNLIGIADLTLGNDSFPYKNSIGVWSEGIINSFGAAIIGTINTTANAVLSTDGSGAPELVDTLPSQVQANITELGTQIEALDMGSNLINNVTDPVSPQDACTKAYADALATGLTVKSPCLVATTANLNATYNNGASGVGATLTNAGSMAALSIDGVALSVGNRICVKDQSAPAQNGIYSVTTVGSGAVNWVITRTTDFDSAAEIQPGDYVLVLQGTLNAATSYVQTATVTTVGTDAIVWNQFSSDVNTLITNIQNDAYNYALDTGTANAHVATLSPTLTSYVTGLRVSLKVAATDATTGVSTLNVNGLGDKTIKLENGSTPLPGNMLIGMIADLRYDGTNFQLLNPANPIQSQPNIIIGGNFSTNPWQRQVSFTAPADGTYTADRWIWNVTGTGVVNVLKTADSPTATQAGVYSGHCLHVDVTTADAAMAATDVYSLQYRVEGYDIALAGFGQSGTRYVTLSFWHKHTKTGTYCVCFRNSASDRAYVAEYTQSTTDTWEFTVITIAVDTSGTWVYDNGIGLKLHFILAIGSNFHTLPNVWTAGNYLASSNQVNSMDNTANNFKINLLKLETGQQATAYPIEFESQVLSRAQRYYRKTYLQNVYPGAVSSNGASTHITTAAYGANTSFTAEKLFTMRSSPSVVIYSPTTGASGNMRNLSTAADTTATASNIGDSGFMMQNVAAIGGASQILHYQWTADSEL